ncbi:MAG: glycosyltransferase [Thiolinea sp.]
MQRGAALAAYYAAADLFIYPSATETFGNVITEAMASGLPVVAFDYAAAAEHIRSGHNGQAVPLDDEAAFQAAAVQLATDAVLRRKLGREARQTAETLSWERVVARLDQTIQSLLQEANHETATAA